MKYDGYYSIVTSELTKLLFGTLYALLLILISQNKRRYRIKYSAALRVRLFYPVPSYVIMNRYFSLKWQKPPLPKFDFCHT